MNRVNPYKKFLAYIIVVLCAFLMQCFNIADSIELALQDGLYQHGDNFNSDIYVIGIDDETLQKNGSFENWSRSGLTELIHLLCDDPEDKPAVIGIDINLYETNNDEIDDALVQAVEEAGNVVLIESAQIKSSVRKDDYIESVNGPFTALKEVAAGIGHVNADYDDDGIIRHGIGDMNYNFTVIPSFASEVCRVYLEAQGKKYIKSFETEPFYISYTGGPNTYYGITEAPCSFSRVISGEYKKSVFRNKIVLIGAYATGTQDDHLTSIDKQQRMYGVEIHANIINQILNGRSIKELTGVKKYLPTIVVGLIMSVILLFMKDKFAIYTCITCVLIYVTAAFNLYRYADILIPVFYPVLEGIAILVTFVSFSYISSNREKDSLVQSYGRYLSPAIAKKIAQSGDNAIELASANRSIAVLFADIRNFTTLSESMEPQQLINMLNRFLSLTTKAIFDNGGTVDKFIGDATMGLFNAPVYLDDFVYRCVCAAIEMQQLAKTLDDTLDPVLQGKVGFGIGIHCGQAIVGNIGADFRMEYTAIGDTVNTASRIENEAKANEILVSEAVYLRIQDRILCKDMGFVTLRGKEKKTRLFKVIGKKNNIESAMTD